MQNKQTDKLHEKQIAQLPLHQARWSQFYLKRTKKHEDKEQGKTLIHEAPRSINHNATQNKNNTGTTALERSVA